MMIISQISEKKKPSSGIDRSETACLSAKFSLPEIEPAVGQNPKAAQAFTAKKNVLLDRQKEPRRILPDNFLSDAIVPDLGLTIRRAEGGLKLRIESRIAVISRVHETGRKTFFGQDRTQGPVRFARGRRPAEVVHPHACLVRTADAFHPSNALTGFQRLDFDADADLGQLLLNNCTTLLPIE